LTLPFIDLGANWPEIQPNNPDPTSNILNTAPERLQYQEKTAIYQS
jgi:hypothetical protein